MLRGSKPRGEPRTMTGLTPKRGRFPGREDIAPEDTDAATAGCAADTVAGLV